MERKLEKREQRAPFILILSINRCPRLAKALKSEIFQQVAAILAQHNLKEPTDRKTEKAAYPKRCRMPPSCRPLPVGRTSRTTGQA